MRSTHEVIAESIERLQQAKTDIDATLQWSRHRYFENKVFWEVSLIMAANYANLAIQALVRLKEEYERGE